MCAPRVLGLALWLSDKNGGRRRHRSTIILKSVLKSFHAVDILAIFAATQASLKQQMTLLSARNSQHHALKPAVIIENGSLCKY